MRGEDSFRELVLSFHWSSGEQSQTIRLEKQVFYSPRPFAGPYPVFFAKMKLLPSFPSPRLRTQNDRLCAQSYLQAWSVRYEEGKIALRDGH